MKTWRSLWFVLLSLVLFCLPALAAEPVSSLGPIVVIPVRDEISRPQFFHLRRAVKDAERMGASAIIVHMDTFGGEVKAALDNMDALLRTKIPTYTYIDNKAISAGALIALATQKVYMDPSGVIGAAAPVSGGGEDLAKTMADKAISMISAKARGAAERCGHNPDLAEAFIRKEAELKFGDKVIDKPDTLLTLDATQAVQQFNGKPLFALGTAESLEKMIELAGLKGQVTTIGPTGFERVAIFLTAFAPLLLLGGIIGAYIEIKTPGFGIAGIASICCFLLFFASNYLAGLAGQEVLIFFFLGVALIITEFFLPGTILPGALGVILVLGSLIYAMVDRYPNQPLLPTADMLTWPLINLILALLGSIVAAYLLAKYLPRTRLYHAIVLGETTPTGTGRLEPASAPLVAMGASGVARTVLRPSGKADFDGRLLDVVSQGEWINPGEPLRVVSVEGSRVVVAAGAPA